MDRRRYDEIAGILLIAASVLILVSLVSYTPKDLAIFTSSPNRPAHNFAGIIGAWLAGILLTIFGFVAYLFAILLFSWALAKFLGKAPQILYIRLIAALFLFATLSALFSSVALIGGAQARIRFGGILGLYFSDILLRYFGKVGTYVLLASLSLLSLTLASEFTALPAILKGTRSIANSISRWMRAKRAAPVISRSQKSEVRGQRSETPVKIQMFEPKLPPAKPKIIIEPLPKPQPPPKSVADAPLVEEADGPRAQKPKVVTPPAPRVVGAYKLPSVDLMDSPPPIAERQIKEDLQKSATILEETLRDFDLEVKVTQIDQGPTITTYELEPAPGVKVGRIAALSDDIALAMKAYSVRIVAPIPGKSRVGVEVPNTKTSLVYLREIFESQEYKKVAQYKLPLVLGKDVSGEPAIAELADMPHLLIAGTTGSGKTVCVNSIITSLLYKATPDEIKFIMVDPKMVELAIFNGIPHLLAPVITDAKKASLALDWVVHEMEERYKLLAKIGVRNIAQYNEKTCTVNRVPCTEDINTVNGKRSTVNSPSSDLQKLPYIIVIVDELADLMMVAQNEIEAAITRLAQLSRAVGIHMILATQRPSVDVVTGVIKANFPARISFKVASKVDSRTVLDMNGADKLLGKGDMLFLKPGEAKPIRGQGTLIQDPEIERVVGFIKSQREPDYDEEILKEDRGGAGFGKLGKDEFFEDAARLIVQTGQASVSILQRRLRLGYTRAARLIDMMEEAGIVGPYCGSKPREILVANLDELEEKLRAQRELENHA